MKGSSTKIIYLQVIHVIFLKRNKLAICYSMPQTQNEAKHLIHPVLLLYLTHHTFTWCWTVFQYRWFSSLQSINRKP